MPRTAREMGEGRRSTWRGRSRLKQNGLKYREERDCHNLKLNRGCIFTHLYLEKTGGGGWVGGGYMRGEGAGGWGGEIGMRR